MPQKTEITIQIEAPPSIIWKNLTNPNLMKNWMGEPEMQIEIHTDWVIGNPIIITGFHHGQFENKGTVLQFAPQKILQYSHLSSISRLPNTAENYSIITFLLTPNEEQTVLTVKVENCPTEIIFKHLDFYWRGTIALIKKHIEQL